MALKLDNMVRLNPKFNKGTSCTKVRVDSGTSWPKMGTSWLRYELTTNQSVNNFFRSVDMTKFAKNSVNMYF